MFASTIIVDPKSQIRAKQDIDTFVVAPTVKTKKAVVRMEDIRAMLSWSSKASYGGGGKTIVIEGFDQSGAEVSNALLKLLEEPPPQTRIFLLISQREAALDTIISRCAVVESDQLTDDQLIAWGLIREMTAPSLSTTTWSEFIQMPADSQLEWMNSLLKGGKGVGEQLASWHTEIAASLQATPPSAVAEHLEHLSLVNECLEADHHNVLPRLILSHLVIQLNHKEIPSFGDR